MQLVGRERELVDAVERLNERRLVTIVGPGGIGKTALAKAAGREAGLVHTGGTELVDLTRVDHTDGVFEVIAGQLGYADFASLLNSPSEQPALVVVDNCEHVLDAAAEAIEQMLAARPTISVLATSRSPLDLSDESILSLGPLPIPLADVADSAAARLFTTSARDNGALVSADDLALVAEVCRRVDGVPLALEIAAARLRTSSLVELIAELDQRPHALARRRFRGQASHRSVADVVNWSYDLLEERQQLAFVRLAVFAGPFTAQLGLRMLAIDGEPEAAARVLLDDLVDASLVVADSSGETTWFRLLHPVRSVALDRLQSGGQFEATQSHLVDLVVDLAFDVIARAAAGWGADVLDDLLGLYDSLSAALRWTLTSDDDGTRAVTLAAVLWGVAHQAHTVEIGALAERVLAKWPDTTLALWPDAAATAATCRYLVGDVDDAIELATAALGPATGTPFAPATLRRVLAQSFRARGDTAAASAMFLEAAEAAASSGAFGFAMELQVDHALSLAELGDVRRARTIAEAAITEAIEREAPINRAWGRAGLGDILLRHSAAEALPLIEEALADARTIGYPAGQSFGLRSLAAARIELGDLGGAAQALLDLLEELLQRGGLNDLPMALDLAALVLEPSGTAGWADLAVTAAALPVTSMSKRVDADLFVRAAATGEVLAPREAFAVSRELLSRVVAGGGHQHEPTDPSNFSVVNGFVRDGDVWRISFEGSAVILKQAKGIEDLVVLLAQPGREISCLDLMGSSVAARGSEDEVLDPTARAQYEQRVRDLQDDLEAAELANDIGSVERLQAELDAIVDQLTAALGLGGRSRKTTSESERARSAVTQRLRGVVRRLEAELPSLGIHLRASLQTGVFCSYTPAHPQDWVIQS